MALAFVRPKRRREPRGKAELFPRGERGVVCGGVRRPPADRMLRAERRITKAELRGAAGLEPERALEHLRD